MPNQLNNKKSTWSDIFHSGSKSFFLIVFLSLIFQLGFGQSLQLEAWKLQQFLSNPTKTNIQVDNITNWKLNDKPILNKETNLSTVGSFSLTKINGFSTSDTVNISYGDQHLMSTLDSLIRIDNLPNKVALSGSSKKMIYNYSGAIDITSLRDSSNLVMTKGYPASRPIRNLGTSYSIDEDKHFIILHPKDIDTTYNVEITLGPDKIIREIPKLHRLHVVKLESEVQIYTQMDFNKLVIVKQDYYELASILALHNSFLDTINTVDDLIKTYQDYEDNPYLYPLLKNSFYGYNLDHELRLMNFDDKLFNNDINTNKHKHYSWIDEMYELHGQSVIEETEKKDKTYYLNLKSENNSSVSLLSSESDQANNPISKEFSLNQTTIIAGLSDFILARAKEELSMTFLQKFKNNLNDGEHPEYRTLFPKTTDLLLDFDISNYKTMLDGIRQTFSQDISNLGLNLPKLLQLEAYTKNNKFSNDLYNVALFFNLINQIYADKSVEEILINTYKTLEQREKQLNEIINLELACQLDSTSSRAKVDTLSDKLLTFNNNLNSVYQTNMVAQKNILDQINEIMGNTSTPKNLKEKVRDAIADLNKIGEAKSSFYLTINNEPIEIFNYLSNYTNNYIHGLGYYGDYLKNGYYDMDNFHKYFNVELADSIYILKGLEQIKAIESLDFKSTLSKWSSQLQELTGSVELNRIELEYIKEQSIFNQAKLAYGLDSLITNGLSNDIKAYESKGVSKSTYFDLAALSYLSEVKNSNKNWLSIKDYFPITNADSLFKKLAANEISNDTFKNKIASQIRFLDTIKVEISRYKNDLNKITPISESNYLSEFDNLIIKSTTIDSSILKPFKNIQDSLTIAINTITSVQKSQESLKIYYEHLRKVVDENKVKCLHNTVSLLGLTEFATHLLYSLQDTFYKTKAVYTVDTTQVSYSILNRDTTSTFQKPKVDTTIVGNVPNVTNWISETDYQSLFKNDEARTIYLGLLYQQLSNLKHSDDLSIENLPLFTTKALNSIININESRNAIELKKSSGLSISFNDRLPLLKSIVELVTLTLETPFTGRESLIEKSPILKTYLDIIKDGLSLYDNLSKKSYTSAVRDAVSIFKVVAKNKKSDNDNSKGKVKSERLLSKLSTYGSFMSEVVKANSPEQVKAALYNVAAPAGSSRIKREYMTNFSLNSYLGVAGGLEFRKVDQDYTHAASIALSVPIGFTYSWKLKNDNSGSWSIFAPILDIGAVTAFRFDDNNVSDLPDLNFQNFISPGVFIFRNFPNSPFTLGAGYQYGPTVRNIADDMSEQASTYRILMSLTIDVPLLNFSSGNQAVIVK